jgi:hypothetical protein
MEVHLVREDVARCEMKAIRLRQELRYVTGAGVKQRSWRSTLAPSLGCDGRRSAERNPMSFANLLLASCT